VFPVRTAVYHKPALLAPTVEGLHIVPAGTYVDVTFGGGGHSRAILAALGPKGRLFAFDQDPAAAQNLPADPRIVFVPASFARLQTELAARGVAQVDGVLGDFGVSFHQFDTPDRGFSYRFDGPLDMRMNPQDDSRPTAADVLNNYTADELARLLRLYGDVPNAGQVARALAKHRQGPPFSRINHLLEALDRFLPRGKEYSYLSQVFQALRVEVNDELGSLQALLRQLLDVVRPGGYVSLISYHSMEDRLVKHFLSTGTFDGRVTPDVYGHVPRPFHILTRKPLVPDEDEVRDNPRARSAKLRIGQRLAPDHKAY